MTRDRVTIFCASLVGAAFLAAVFYQLYRQSYAAGGVEGVIVDKQFESAPETELTVGSGGVHKRTSAGIFLFRVRALSGDRIYTVTVDSRAYAAHQIGEKYYFVPLR